MSAHVSPEPPPPKLVTLTFDNGPDPAVTPRVLDILRERGVRAWFFVLGRALASEEGRALVRRAREEGHRVGNHSFTHQTPLGEDPRPSAVDDEIVATEALLTPLTPGEPRCFRPFGGGGALGPHLLSAQAVSHLSTHGYTCVLWTSVPRDWLDPQGWRARALVDCEGRAHCVVVLHDIPGACVDELPAFLDEAKARGFAFTTSLPLDCTPILDGRIVADLRPFTAGPR